MATISGYFDASGSPSTEVVAVAALVSTPERWIEFEKQWNECLESFGVLALHMKDFAHFRGEFSSWGDDEPRRKRFLSGLLWIIENHMEYTAACGIEMSVFDEVNADYALGEFMRPYTMASVSCAWGMREWAEQSGHQTQDILYVFEKGDTDQNNLKQCWESLLPKMRVDPIFLKKIDSHPRGTDPRPIRAFEAADLVAYENLKANTTIKRKGGTAYTHELRKPILRMRGLPGSEQWRVIDRTDNLRTICDKWNVPKR